MLIKHFVIFQPLGALAKLWKTTFSFVMSVRLSAGNDSASSEWIFMKFYIWVFSKICREIQVSLKSEKKGTLHEDQYTILIISRSVHLRMRNFSDKRCRENQNTFKFNKSFRKSCRLWKYVEKILYSRAGHRRHGARAFHAGYLEL